ncbi:hypothetical protein RKE29_30485, partial [Streptomyces sp. B1866]|nr:hypothetical protein [Streptomyces sp. B1866]
TMQDTASPTSAFVRERCTTGPACEVTADDLWAAWKEWAEDSGVHPGTKQMLGRNLLSVVPQLRRVRRRGDDGRQGVTYSGITLHSGARNDVSRDSTPLTTPTAAALSRDESRLSPLWSPPEHRPPCAVCGRPLQPVTPGQTTHP